MWLVAILLQLTILFAGIRSARRMGAWSWTTFCFSLGFAVLESAILFLPIYYIHDVHDPYFWPVYIIAWVIAAISFVLFILIIRRWASPGNPSA